MTLLWSTEHRKYCKQRDGRLARRRAERPDAQQAVDSSAVYRGCLRRWRMEISVALQMGNYGIYAASATALRGRDTMHAAPAVDNCIVDDVVGGR